MSSDSVKINLSPAQKRYYTYLLLLFLSSLFLGQSLLTRARVEAPYNPQPILPFVLIGVSVVTLLMSKQEINLAETDVQPNP